MPDKATEEALVKTSMAAIDAAEGRMEEGGLTFADIFGSSFGQAVPSYVMSESAVFASANGL